MNIEARARGAGNESTILASLRILGSPRLRPAGLRCTASIMNNFFFLQYKEALFKRAPVSRADHPLDERIPFTPGRITTYLDFVAFWIRTSGFLLSRFGRRAIDPVKEFLNSMGAIYKRAAEVYAVNFSTTRRPLYLARPRFVIIHLVDPHLMCIPSLHVMVVILTYTFFRSALRRLGEEERYAAQIEEVRQWSLAITEAVLYVKQHSVNCIPAAMYAMTRFDSSLFPPEEGKIFAEALFRNPGKAAVTEADGDLIREHILSLYRRFLSEGEKAVSWKDPLLDFLNKLPKV